MSDELVKIKGTKAGLLLHVEADAAFSAVLDELREKLSRGSGFFCRGTVMQMEPDILSKEEYRRLKSLFQEYGIVFRALPKQEEQPPAPPELQEQGVSLPHFVENAQQVKDVQEMVVINRTLRGGQEIRTGSSVLVCGNVNPGAQIIAGGSIDVRGICRGIVHAGAFGDRSAVVVADGLMPVQIRIADAIARSPDHAEKSNKTERASWKDGQIVIEPIER